MEFWKWKGDQFYEVEHGAYFDESEGLLIMDMGDVNSDKTTDLISISSEKRGFGVHYFSEDDLIYNSMFYSTLDCEIINLAFLPFDHQIMLLCNEADGDTLV